MKHANNSNGAANMSNTNLICLAIAGLIFSARFVTVANANSALLVLRTVFAV